MRRKEKEDLYKKLNNLEQRVEWLEAETYEFRHPPKFKIGDKVETDLSAWPGQHKPIEVEWGYVGKNTPPSRPNSFSTWTVTVCRGNQVITTCGQETLKLKK